MLQTFFYLFDYGTGFCRKCYFYSGKLVFLSKFGFEIKNNIFKQSYMQYAICNAHALVLEKFEIFTLFYIWVYIKWMYSKITAT